MPATADATPDIEVSQPLPLTCCRPLSAGGPALVRLRCVQPLSGARLAAAVVHVCPCEYRHQAVGGKPPSLTGGYEVRQPLTPVLPCLPSSQRRFASSASVLAATPAAALVLSAWPAASAPLLLLPVPAGSHGAPGSGGCAAPAQAAAAGGGVRPAGPQLGALPSTNQQGTGR